ncbi:hypothetical protein EJ08DRAFT_719738 [Tothia fuscella]|uniref:Uncharacterized protein n=1 Tax=Tothia fuscella TaxID=1048955 RepID=A0A9P4NND4_9PEZI|nr:hypothetical protein EJ08DRAFT_719738 [Tothia fuscella]
MKSLLVIATALAVGYVGAIPADHPLVAKLDKLATLNKRQGGMTALANNMFNPKGGKVAAVAGAPPTRQANQKDSPAGANRVKMRYGPYKVPNMGVTNILGEEGALWNYADPVAEKPCDAQDGGACTIVGMYAGLEYPDGKNANIDSGLWLHHFVLFNVGPGRQDATCSSISLPHMLVGSSASGSERLFSSGNERTQAIVPNWPTGKNVGYKLKKEDKFALIVDLMNENMKDEVVYLTITFDIMSPAATATYDDMKPVWFDVAQCLTSEWPAPYNSGNYTVPAATWVANFDGEIIGAAGHLHDGGQRVTLEVDGKQVCNSEAKYGETKEYVQAKAMHANPNSATEHISSMSVCMGPKFLQKDLVKGQKWKLRAEYDYNKNKGMMHGNGKQSTVMGIAIMYVRVKK